MTQFSVRQAKTNLSRLIADALDGEDIVIACGAVPAVRLTPVKPVGRRRFGALRGRITVDARFQEPLPAEELAAWERG